MSDILRPLLEGIPLPKMVKFRQRFGDTKLEDPISALRAELAQPGRLDRIEKGQKVAVAVGSR